ncbi:MAG TPA: serine/threonine-protein kinase [Kofleriaceae bacterium]|nr:serine/threonine-protein kinase [Kofleriaceae bacterium]
MTTHDPQPTGTIVLDLDERGAEVRNLLDLCEDPTIRLDVSDDVSDVGPDTIGVIGDYQVEAVVGQGGMGVVHRARHRTLGTPVAMKLLRPEVSARPLVVRRFVREGRVLGRLQDPGIVQCYEFGVARSGTPYIVMEYMEGTTLGGLLERQPVLAVPVALAIARQVARALGAAHRCGVVHRDVKPNNVFLVVDQSAPAGMRVKVMDFGLAKLLEPDTEDPHPSTATGSLIGTPAYMSPEQCRGAGEIDARSDIYSLGCVLYSMVCGRPPFTGQGMGDYVTAHLLEPPLPPSALVPGLPPEIDQLILTALAKNPAHRQQTMEELERELAGYVPARAPTAPAVAVTVQPRRRMMKAIAMAAVALTTVLVVAGMAGGDARVSASPATKPITTPSPTPTPSLTPIPSPTPSPTPIPSPITSSSTLTSPSPSPEEITMEPEPEPERAARSAPAARPRPARKRPAPAAAPSRERERGDVMEPRF